MNEIDKEVLISLYLQDKKPMHKIAKEMGISIGSVYNYLKKFGVETRDQKETFTSKGTVWSDESRKLLSDKKKGVKKSDEQKKRMSEGQKVGGIGHKKIRSDGYVYIYFIDHPRSTSNGYIMEHILVMEALIGRHLLDNECIHHINRKRDDNRKENLMLMTKSEHMSYHMKERYKEKGNK